MCVCNNTIDYKKAFDFDGISISLFIGWYTVFDVIRARVTGNEYLLDVLPTYIYDWRVGGNEPNHMDISLIRFASIHFDLCISYKLSSIRMCYLSPVPMDFEYNR